MPTSVKTIFKNLQNFEPSADLEEKILKAIGRQEKQRIRNFLLISQVGITVSSGIFLGMLAVFGKTFLDSDFMSLFRLVFSDTEIVFHNIGEFSLSLLETLPVFQIIVMIVPVFVLFLMLSWYFKFSKINFKHVN